MVAIKHAIILGSLRAVKVPIVPTERTAVDYFYFRPTQPTYGTSGKDVWWVEKLMVRL